MNWWLAYNIALVLLVIVALAWAYDGRRLIIRAMRLLEMRDGPPTEEIELPPTTRIAPRVKYRDRW
jgi:hypothetical protein